MKKYINNLIIIIFIFMFAILASGCKGKEKNKEDDKDFIDVDYMFEVVKHNGDVVSGLDDMDTFYHITNEKKEKSSIVIIQEYDKDYFNKIKADSEPLAEENVIYKYKIDFDGNTYNYYEVQDKEKELIGNYKYLNYSKSIAMGIYSKHTFEIGYLLTNYEDFNARLYFTALLSSVKIDERIFDSHPIFIYYENSDLYFNNYEVLSITSHKDEKYKDYYSNVQVILNLMKIVNEVQWLDDNRVLSSEIADPNNVVIISVNGTLVNDKNGLMKKSADNKYLLQYTFYLDSKYVSMTNSGITSDTGMIYAKLSDEHIELIESILNDDLIKDFSPGRYEFSATVESQFISYYVEILENNTAKIYMKYPSYNAATGLPFFKLIIEGNYEVHENELTISDNEYIYKFKLSEGQQKGICFKSEGSIIKEEFNEVSDDSFFNYNMYPIKNNDTISILGLGSWDNIISDNMKKYSRKFTKSIYGNLWRVDYGYLPGTAKIYKFDKKGASFLEYNGNIYPIGDYLNGYELIEVAYYHKEYTNILYLICTSENENKKSQIFAFDLNDSTMKIVNCSFNENNNVDIEFEKNTSADGSLILSVYETKLERTKDLFVFDQNKIKLLEENILDYELVPIE